MRKRIIIATVVVSLAMVSIAFASEQSDSVKSDIQARKDAMQARLADAKTQREDALKQKREDRCAKIQERIAERVANFDTIENKHMAVYINMQNRIQKFIDRLSADGVDTSKVQTDLTTLQTKITQFSTDYKTYLDALDSAKSFKCGDTDTATTADVRTTMQAARTALFTVHQDAVAIRTFMRTTVVPDILALKKQKIESKTSDSSSSSISSSSSSESETPELEQ